MNNIKEKVNRVSKAYSGENSINSYTEGLKEGLKELKTFMKTVNSEEDKKHLNKIIELVNKTIKREAEGYTTFKPTSLLLIKRPAKSELGRIRQANICILDM